MQDIRDGYGAREIVKLKLGTKEGRHYESKKKKKPGDGK